jgi:hypothetical protein
MGPFLALAVVGCLLVVASWVWIDADSRAREDEPVSVSIGHLTIETPAAWSLGCLILSVIFVPLYLIARSG